MDPQQPSRIPVTIIGGFLGSGKTTLLNHLITNANGRRFAVVVNDFGAVNIDSRLVLSVEGETIALTNGCICCVIREDLIEAVLKLCATETPPDHIIIETSGVSKPLSVVESFFRPEVQKYVDVQAIITLLDADQALDETGTYADLAYAHVALADIVVINKVDLVPPARLTEVRAKVEHIVPRARIFQTTFGALPVAALFDQDFATAARDASHGHDHGHDNGHDHAGDHLKAFASWTYRDGEKRFCFDAMQRVVEHLPKGIFRAKGLVRLDLPTGEYGVLQVTGRRGRLQLTTPPPGQPEVETEIVFIGHPDTTSEADIRAHVDGAWDAANDPHAPGSIVSDLRAFTVGFI